MKKTTIFGMALFLLVGMVYTGAVNIKGGYDINIDDVKAQEIQDSASNEGISVDAKISQIAEETIQQQYISQIQGDLHGICNNIMASKDNTKIENAITALKTIK